MIAVLTALRPSEGCNGRARHFSGDMRDTAVATWGTCATSVTVDVPGPGGLP